MLAKTSRLNLKKDFKWVTASAKVKEGKFVKMFIRLGDNTQPKIGIALSGKRFSSAVERNKAKRLTSAAFESLISNLLNNINIVALPKTGIIDVKSGDVLVEIEDLLREEKVLVNENTSS